MELELHTLRFKSGGSIVCRHCRAKIVFDGGDWFLTWNNGQTLLIENTDAVVLHRCGRHLEWTCVNCGPVDKVMTFRHRAPFCAACYSEVTQREATPSP